MIDNEFDIQVRSLLQNAEESVSPEVWEGVASRLQHNRRAVVVRRRFWGSFAGVALAAAAVALFVLLRPSVQPSLQPQEAVQPLVAQEVAPETPETVSQPAQEAVDSFVAPAGPAQVAPVPVQQRPQAVQALPSRLLASAVEGPVQRLAVPAVQPLVSAEEDFYLLNRLAQEQEASQARFSLLASGNFQSNQPSGTVEVSGPRFAAPPEGMQVGIYNESPETSFGVPYSAGVGFQYRFAKDWSVGTGVRYSNLSRSFVGDYKGDGFVVAQSDVDNLQHWLDIPLNLYLSLLNKGGWHIQSFVGGACDYLLDNHYLVHNSPKYINYHQTDSPLQWSAALGVGVEYKVASWMGLYLTPNLRYYFRTDLQPRSLRTIQPLRFDLEVGARFCFGQ